MRYVNYIIINSYLCLTVKQKLITDKMIAIYKLETKGCGSYYAVTGDLKSAGDMLRKQLNEENVKFPEDRDIVSFKTLASQKRHFNNKGNDLIIVI